MKVTTRTFKMLHKLADFTPDDGRLLVYDGYMHALETPSLKTIYRTRPLPGMSGFSLQASGEHMVVAFGRGSYGVLRVADGEVVATCSRNELIGDQRYVLSKCAAYVIRLRYFIDVCVLEMSTGRVVWERKGKYQRVAPLDTTMDSWVIFVDQVAEIWSWPFGEAPQRTIPLGCMSNDMHVRNSKVALNLYKTVRIVDLNTGDALATVPADTLTRAVLRDDGSCVVSNRDELCVYSPRGELEGKLRIPEMYFLGHAFHSAHDDAALMCERGVVFIRDLASALVPDNPIVPEWPTITQYEPELASGRSLHPAPPSEKTLVVAHGVDELKQAISRFKRTAWRPTLKQQDGPPQGSKFGGVPWLGKDEEWPRCGQCNEPMNLYLQLRSTDLPHDASLNFSGVLQLFLCSTETYSGGLCQSSEAFSDAQLVRIVDAEGPSSVSELIDEDLFTEMHIVGWVAQEEYPDNSEFEQLGVELNYSQQGLNRDGRWQVLTGDKLLGWPAWEQEIERIRCPECDTPMREIFQIESYDTLPLMLADGGRGWIRQCQTHTRQVCFSWQCG